MKYKIIILDTNSFILIHFLVDAASLKIRRALAFESRGCLGDSKTLRAPSEFPVADHPCPSPAGEQDSHDGEKARLMPGWRETLWQGV